MQNFNLQSALLKCSKKPSKKSAINLMCPDDIKDDFSLVALENNVSVTSLIVSLMVVAIEEHKILKDSNNAK